MSNLVSGAMNFIRSWCYGNAKPAEKRELEKQFNIVDSALKEKTSQVAQQTVQAVKAMPIITKKQVEDKLNALKTAATRLNNENMTDEQKEEVSGVLKTVKARIMQIASGNEAFLSQVNSEIPNLESKVKKYQ